MKLAEIRQLEESRKDQMNVVHLIQEGAFYHAYDWSAWLIAVISFNDKVRMTTKDRKPIHVTRMRRTDVEGAT